MDKLHTHTMHIVASLLDDLELLRVSEIVDINLKDVDRNIPGKKDQNLSYIGFTLLCF